MKTVKTYGIHDQFSLKPGNQESLSIVTNNGISLVVDCPAHTVRSLHNDTELVTRSTQTKVDYLILTHIDNDHVGGIEQLLWWKFFGEKTKLNLITHPEIYRQLWQRIEMIFGQDRTTFEPKIMKIEDFINFTPVEYGKEVKIPEFGSLVPYDKPTIHSNGMDVIAFKVFGEQRENLGNFSADTGFSSDLVDFLGEKEGPIIHEAGAYKEGSFSHTHINELIRGTSREIQKRLFVNHLPEMLEETIKEEIKNNNSSIRFASYFA